MFVRIKEPGKEFPVFAYDGLRDESGETVLRGEEEELKEGGVGD